MKLQVNKKLSLFFPSEERASEIYSIIERERNRLGEFLPWVYQTLNKEDTKNNLQERIENFKQEKSFEFYLKHEDKIIGSVGFVEIDKKNQKGEIGYWIDSKYSGKGYVTQSVQTCIEYGFTKLMLNKIIIRCADNNISSAAVAHRLGFTLEGNLREDRIINTHFINLLNFGLLKSEYESV